MAAPISSAWASVPTSDQAGLARRAVADRGARRSAFSHRDWPDRRGCGRGGRRRRGPRGRHARRASDASASHCRTLPLAFRKRWISLSSTAPGPAARSANRPPAPMAGSWPWSPTKQHVGTRAGPASETRRARAAVGAVPASSTTSRVPGRSWLAEPVGCPARLEEPVEVHGLSSPSPPRARWRRPGRGRPRPR